MRTLRYVPIPVFAFLLCGAIASSVRAATLFIENFSAPTGHTTNNFQVTTGFPVAFGGNYAGWTKSGTSTFHLVDRGAGNWAPMLWSGGANNIITSPSVSAGNSTSQLYSVRFDLAPAVYATAGQATIAGDGVLVEVLNSSSAVITSRVFYPGTFASQASPGNLPYNPVTLFYAGNGFGTGAASVRFSSTNAGSGRFGGSVDNLNFSSLASLPSGTVLFSETFDNPTGQNFNATQAITGFPVAFGGNLANWTKAGDGAVHLVNRGGSNLAAMFYDGQPNNNVITSAAISAANTLGNRYQISFELAAANYNSSAQGTTALDGVVLEVLDSLNNVLATQVYLPGAFASEASMGSLPFSSEMLTYFGTGSGDGSIRMRFSANNPGAQRFGGSIDNVTLSVMAIPEPASVSLWSAIGLSLAAFAYVRARKTK